MKKSWAKRDPIKNYFPLPNEIYHLGLSHGAIAVYGYLLSIEDRSTYQCYPSYATIGHAVGMSRNTVRKYVAELEERRLIRTEQTTITTADGRKRNGKNNSSQPFTGSRSCFSVGVGERLFWKSFHDNKCVTVPGKCSSRSEECTFHSCRKQKREAMHSAKRIQTRRPIRSWKYHRSFS